MMETTKCCVPYCGRSTKERYSEWICSVHWPMIPKRTRQRRSQAKRLLKRARQRLERQYQRQGCQFTSAQWGRVEAAQRLVVALWERCKREAIEAAGGLR